MIDGTEQRDDLGGKLEGYLKALLARQESEEKSHRSTSAALDRRERGYWTAGKAPTGYDNAPATDGSKHRTLTPNDDADKVTAGFEAVAEGESIHGTAKRVGLHPGTFSSLLHKPVYAGFTVIDGEEKEYPGGWTPLVSRDTFDRVQTKLEPHGKTDFRQRNKRQPFGEIARCAECQRVVVAHYGGSGRYYYRCPKKGHASVVAEILEAYVAAALGTVSSFLRFALDSGEWRDLVASEEDVDALARQLTETETKIKKTTGKLVRFEGRPNVEKAMEEELDGLDALVTQLRDRHDSASRDAETLRVDLTRLDEALRFGREQDDPRNPTNARDFWRSSEVGEKRSTLSAILSSIAVGNDSVTLTFRYGFPAPLQLRFDPSADRKSKASHGLRSFGFGPKAGDGAEAPSSTRGARTPLRAYR